MQQKQNEALFFDAQVAMKVRSTTRCRKRACIFHLNFGWPSNQVDIVR